MIADPRILRGEGGRQYETCIHDCLFLIIMICHTKLDYDKRTFFLEINWHINQSHHHSKDEYSCEHTTELEH